MARRGGIVRTRDVSPPELDRFVKTINACRLLGISSATHAGPLMERWYMLGARTICIDGQVFWHRDDLARAKRRRETGKDDVDVAR